MNHCGYGTYCFLISSTFYSFLPTPNNIEPRAQQIDANRCIFGDTEQGTHRNTPRTTWSFFLNDCFKMLRRNVTLSLHVHSKSGVLEAVHQQWKRWTVKVLHGFYKGNLWTCWKSKSWIDKPKKQKHLDYVCIIFLSWTSNSCESARYACVSCNYHEEIWKQLTEVGW